MAENTGKEVKSKDKKPSFWTGIKREWNKIIWISKEDIAKRTGIVVVVSLIMGVLITVIDTAALYLVDLLIAL